MRTDGFLHCLPEKKVAVVSSLNPVIQAASWLCSILLHCSSSSREHPSLSRRKKTQGGKRMFAPKNTCFTVERRIYWLKHASSIPKKSGRRWARRSVGEAKPAPAKSPVFISFTYVHFQTDKCIFGIRIEKCIFGPKNAFLGTKNKFQSEKYIFLTEKYAYSDCKMHFRTDRYIFRTENNALSDRNVHFRTEQCIFVSRKIHF